MDLSDIYIPPTPEEERDILRNEVKMLRAEIERLRADLAYETQLHKDATEEIDRLKAKLRRVNRMLGSDKIKKLKAEIKLLKKELSRLRELIVNTNEYDEGYQDGYDAGYDSGYDNCRRSQDYENDEERIQ